MSFQVCHSFLDRWGSTHGATGAPSSTGGGGGSAPESEISKALRASGFPDQEKPWVASQHAPKILNGVHKRIIKLEETHDKFVKAEEPSNLLNQTGSQFFTRYFVFHFKTLHSWMIHLLFSNHWGIPLSPKPRMKNKIAALKTTLSSQSDQINKKYSEGVVEGFTKEPLELLK